MLNNKVLSEEIIGIVLVGGKSSRMGENKALLNFKDQPLIEHMLDKLKSLNLKTNYISGNLPCYSCIQDAQLFQGPAVAINHICQRIFTSTDCLGILILPIDMPLLPISLLKTLIKAERSVYFEHYPLPLFITKFNYIESQARSIKQLIQDWQIQPIPLQKHNEIYMLNTNTPMQWQEALKYEFKD